MKDRMYTLRLHGDPRDYGYFGDKKTAKMHRKEGFYVAKGPDHPRLNDKGNPTTHHNNGNTGDGFRKTANERRRQRSAKK